MKTAEEIAERITVEWTEGAESDEDQNPIDPDGPYFEHLKRRIIEAIAERDKRVIEVLELIPSMLGHGQHWDETMRGGAGCRKCIEQRAIMEKVSALLAELRKVEK